MDRIRKTVDDITLLIRSGDLSDTPTLRRLHADFLNICAELNAELEQCRQMMENGALKEARQLNNSFSPPLTQQAEQLAFPGNEEFFSICREYGLAQPEMPDPALLDQLNAPISSGEKHLHALLQDYRKIARSAGKKDRIELLRKIVAKLPDSPRWRNDLLAAERARFQEIEQALKELPPGDEALATLEGFYREIMSPELLAPAKPELTEQIREKLRPLQQRKIRREIGERLQCLQELCIERNVPRLQSELERWKSFCANPLVKLSAQEEETVAGVENFLRSAEDEMDKDAQFAALVRRLEQKIADNAPYSELAGDYNQLLLLDRPVPPSLQDRLENMEQESRQNERLLNVRRCFYGVGIALVVVAAVLLTVRLTRYYLTVGNAAADMQRLLDRKSFGEAAEFYEKLKRTEPEIARDAKLLARYSEALQRRDEEAALKKKEEQEFARLIDQIRILAGQEDLHDVSRAIDRHFADARKIMARQPKPMLDQFRQLETAVIRRRTELRRKQETGFVARSDAAVAKLRQLASAIDERDPGAAERQAEMVKQAFDDAVVNLIDVPAALKNREAKHVADAFRAFGFALEKAKKSGAPKYPKSFEAYAGMLEKIRYQEPSLAAVYADALASLPRWKQEFENSRTLLPPSAENITDVEKFPGGLLRQDFERIAVNPVRSTEFARFFGDLQKMNKLRELLFTAADGRTYFFYADSEKLRVERLRRPKRVNISFTADGSGGFFLFSFLPADEKTPFHLLEAPAGLPYKLPGAFARLCGSASAEAGKISTPWAGQLVAEEFRGLSTDGPGVNQLLTDALKFLVDPGKVRNPYLREMLVRNFLRALCSSSGLLYEAAEMLAEIEGFFQGGKRNWREPQAYAGNAGEEAALETLLGRVDPERFAAAGKLRADFVFAFHSRRLVPAGVVYDVGGARLKIHLFRAAPPVEMLLLTGKGVSLLPREAARKDAVFAPVAGRLFPGQVIWTFDDDRRSADFVKEWSEKARKLNVEFKIKPLICPAEIVL